MSDDLRIIPERDETRARPQGGRPGNGKTKQRKAPPPKPPSNSSPLVGVLCFLVILVSGAAAYLFFQTQTLSQQRDDLDARVVVLEEKLSVTDESLSESGAAIQSILKDHSEDLELHMSEIRKLWGVAYDTNRTNIEALEKTQATHSARINSVRDSLANVEPLAEGFETLKSRVDATANQSLSLSAGFDEAETQLRELSDSLVRMQSDMNSQEQAIASYGEAIDAIDQYRIQINQRVLQLENQLRAQ